MSDLVGRLRKWSVFGYGYEASCDMKEAATAIEAQSANMANAARLLSEQTDRIEQLESALRWIDQQRYTGRNTINLDNAYEMAIALNAKLLAVMDTARAALAAPSGAMEKRT